VRLQFVLALTCLIFTFAILLPGQQGEPPGPAQPIAFDHKLHVTDLKVRCKMCHPNPDPGEMMDMPEVSGCMQCHSAIKPKDAESRKLEAFAREKRDYRLGPRLPDSELRFVQSPCASPGRRRVPDLSR
jgi:hypothetical protein